MNMKKVTFRSYNFRRAAVAAMLLAAGTSIVACKDFTELAPISLASEESAFASPGNIKLAMMGVYESAAIGTYQNLKSSARGYPFGAAAIEQGEMRGEDMLNIDQFYAITYEGGANPTSLNNVTMWHTLYALINQANILIEGVQKAGAKGVITDAEAKAYEGEARFMRALSHHELLVHFSFPYADAAGGKWGVPYRTKAITSLAAYEEGLKMDRGTVKDCYTKLIADLDFAEANLPDKQPDGVQRATKGAAIALKARIKQHMGDWDGVIAESNKLIPAAAPYKSPIGAFQLTAEPDGPFTSYKNNTESIFSIANGPNANGGSNGALPAMFGPASLNGRGLVATSPILYNASFWKATDKRRALLQVYQPTTGSRYYFNYKYRDYTTRADWAPMLRYAEVLLTAAEAHARKGENDRALALLNAVRNRSVEVGDQFTTPPADLVLAILQERRIELAGEGRRWADIHRLALDAVYGFRGIPAKMKKEQMKLDGTDYNAVTPPTFPTTGGVPSYAYESFRFLWPIPAEETAANPTLRAQQNKLSD